MTYIIDTSKSINLTLTPETTIQEIVQNVSVIISTPKFTIPLDRNFGTNQSFIDKPIEIAKTLIIAEIYKAVGEYEPRVEVENITFSQDNTNGILSPILEVNILNEYL